MSSGHESRQASNATSIAEQTIDQPWGPTLSLSLDGGGVRGISTLLILRRLMEKVALKDQEHCNTRDENNKLLPAHPCHYFNLMVGTSTGGLIAVMLGRMRLSIDECLIHYFYIAKDVFASPKRLHHFRRTKYDTRQMEKQMKAVVQTWSSRKNPDEALRQRDSAENVQRSCLSAVISVTPGVSADEIHFFRSYDQEWRSDSTLASDWRNTGPAFSGPIWQACRATTAAPTFFKTIKIRNHGKSEFMDGGVLRNNPSVETWIEAQRISRAEEDRNGFLLSVGTGRSRPETRFSRSKFPLIGELIGVRMAIFRTMFKEFTDTEQAHEHMVNIIKADRSNSNQLRYSRLTVPLGHNSLEKMPLDEWKIKKLSRAEQNKRGRQTSPPMEPVKAPSFLFRRPTAKQSWHHTSSQSSNKGNAVSPSQGQSSGESLQVNETSRRPITNGSTPSQPNYETLERIKSATNAYLTERHTNRDLDQIADRLVAFAKARRRVDRQRWDNFVNMEPSRNTTGEQPLFNFVPP